MALPASAEFTRAAMKALGIEGDTEFSDRLKLGSHGPGKVGRWRTGKSQPNYEATMTILDACGWLNMSEDAASADSSPRDPLAVIAEGVTELLEQQAELLRRMPVPVQRAPRKSRSASASKRRASGS